MTDRRDFIGNFLTEHYTVFLDGKEVNKVSAGAWADLGGIMNAAERKLPKEIMAGRKVCNRYINVNKYHICFWTYKDNEWWTL
jgi:hypothetical protein